MTREKDRVTEPEEEVSTVVVSEKVIKSRVYVVRRHQVMMDSDFALQVSI